MVDGELRDATIVIEREEYPIAASELHRVCRRLKIDNPRDVTHWVG